MEEFSTVTTEHASGMRRHCREHGFGVWVVAEKAHPDDIIGFTGLTHRVVHDRAALNLYYRYRPSAWGKGFASEGARKALQQAQTLLPDLPIVAYTSISNIGSQRTAESAGLRRMPELEVDHGSHVDIYLTFNW